jgi:hypothetical protein
MGRSGFLSFWIVACSLLSIGVVDAMDSFSTAILTPIALNSKGYAVFTVQEYTLDATVMVNGLLSPVISISINCYTTTPINIVNTTCANSPFGCTVCAQLSTTQPHTSTIINAYAITQIQLGKAYVVVTSAAFPNGELVGQIGVPSPSLPDHYATIVDANSVLVGHGFFWVMNATVVTMSSQVFSIINQTTVLLGVGIVDAPANWIEQMWNFQMGAMSSRVLTSVAAVNLTQFRLFVGLSNGSNSTWTRGQIYPSKIPIITNADISANTLVKLDVYDRGFENATITVAIPFNSTTLTNSTNEIWLHFPPGFHVDWSSYLIYWIGLNEPDTVEFTTDDIVKLGWYSASSVLFQPVDLKVRLTITGVQLPNNCDNALFTVSTHHCYEDDILNAGVIKVHRCDAFPIATINFWGGQSGSPQGCTLCNACKQMFQSSTGDQIFSCEQNGLVFTRVNVAGGSCVSP